MQRHYPVGGEGYAGVPSRSLAGHEEYQTLLAVAAQNGLGEIDLEELPSTTLDPRPHDKCPLFGS